MPSKNAASGNASASSRQDKKRPNSSSPATGQKRSSKFDTSAAKKQKLDGQSSKSYGPNPSNLHSQAMNPSQPTPNTETTQSNDLKPRTKRPALPKYRDRAAARHAWARSCAVQYRKPGAKRVTLKIRHRAASRSEARNELDRLEIAS